jgi:hypothetical protein
MVLKEPKVASFLILTFNPTDDAALTVSEIHMYGIKF